jgi:O-antigen/teichoic acid export membrane protein
MLAVNALFQLGLQVFHPVLAHRYATDRAAGRFLVGALVMYALAATLPASAVLILAAPWLIPPLLGIEFTDAAPVFAVLATSLVPTIVGSVFGYALMADGRYRLYNLICGGGALLSLVSCALAFHIYPDAEAVLALTVTVTAMGLACGIAAWRLDLVQLGAISWRQLSPARIRKILQER